jgi:hypothetical protein
MYAMIAAVPVHRAVASAVLAASPDPASILSERDAGEDLIWQSPRVSVHGIPRKNNTVPYADSRDRE